MAFSLRAQVLQGRVVDGANEDLPLFPVAVTNISQNKTVYSDAQGRFSLPAREGDRLLLQFNGYRTLQWTVSAYALQHAQFMMRMYILEVQLNEFTLRPKYQQYQIDSAHRRDVYARPLVRYNTRSLSSPVSLVAERFNKKSKSIRNFQKSYNQFENQKFIDIRYTPRLVQELTNLSGDTLAWFMNAYPVPVDYARTASDLELKMWIRSNFKEWLKLDSSKYPPVIDTAK